MEHELKIWPENYELILKGLKPYEIRKWDRTYNIGDTVTFHEYDPKDIGYTGRTARALIMHVTLPGKWGLPLDIGVFGILLTYPRQGMIEEKRPPK